MPAYDPINNFKPVLNPGVGINVWNNEVVAVEVLASPPTLASSAQVSLRREQYYPSVLSAEIQFASNPGVCQVDMQTADTDQDQYYVTKASLKVSSPENDLNAHFVGRIEAVNVVARFVRLQMVVLTNAGVAVTATIF